MRSDAPAGAAAGQPARGAAVGAGSRARSVPRLPTSATSEEDAPVRSVARALDILFALERGRQTAGDVARASGLSKVTARRLLSTLVACDLVIHDAPTSTYLLGPGCFGIFDAVARGAGGMDVLAGAVLRQLADRSRETVAIYVRAGPRILCVAQVPSSQEIRHTAHLGVDQPIHTSAMGRVLLAFTEPAERQEVLDRAQMLSSTEAMALDRAALEEDLERIRRLGFAVSRGEPSLGAALIAAPIFTPDGRPLAALGVMGPEERLPDRTLAAIRADVIASANEVSRRVASLGRPGHDGAERDPA